MKITYEVPQTPERYVSVVEFGNLSVGTWFQLVDQLKVDLSNRRISESDFKLCTRHFSIGIVTKQYDDFTSVMLFYGDPSPSRKDDVYTVCVNKSKQMYVVSIEFTKLEGQVKYPDFK